MKTRRRPSEYKAAEDGALRVALYMRVSTGQQARSDLSIPDQRRQAHDFCAAQGWRVVSEFVDAGLSGTNDSRPEFQRMLTMAASDARPFDVVLVHSISRLARHLVILENAAEELERHGVQLASITQRFDKGPEGVLLRQIVGAFDQHQSRENAKHVARTMLENARQGFWNGSHAPYGYRTFVVEQRGAKLKKHLAVDPVEAEIVRLMFRLFRNGDGVSGPMGIKAITAHLNANGHRTRGGARWGVGQVHRLITSPTYKGEHHYNCTNSRTRERRAETEHVIVPVPAIIEAPVFDAVRKALRERNPKVAPPRIVNGPTQLAGVAKCARCGGGMTIRTGKSGRYRYYTCSTSAQQGKSACEGLSVPMDRLDDAVTTALAEKLLTPERVSRLLAGLMERQNARTTDHTQRVAALRDRVSEAERGLVRLYDAIEKGILDPSDDTLKERIAAAKTARDIARVSLERALAELSPQVRVTAEKVARFTSLMRQNIVDGAPEFRRAYIRSIIDAVEVDRTEIKIHGRKDVLERLVMAEGATPAGVPSFVRNWRTRHDSNVRPPPSEGGALSS